MIRNYMRIAIRNLAKNKMSSVINIGGLAVGMAVAILIGLWIHDELSYNKSFQHYDRVGRVMVKWKEGKGANSSLPMPMGIEIRKSFPEDLKYVVMSSQRENHIVSTGDKKLGEEGSYMQPEATEMFSLTMLRGTRSA